MSGEWLWAFLKRLQLRSLGLLLVQLVLICWVLQDLDMLSPVYRRVVWILAGAFVINHVLPLKWRLNFFAALSLAGIVFVLGINPIDERRRECEALGIATMDAPMWDASIGLPRAAALLAVGLCLIWVCGAGMRLWKKVVLLLAIGAAVAGLRMDVVDLPQMDIVWLLLPAIFMFRLMVYLYDRSATGARPTWAQSAAYFFMLPNACNLLLPVIDFKRFMQSHYTEEAFVTYQRGVRWIVRGMIHLLIYRYVDQIVAIRASSVDSGISLIRFLVGNVFLYLKVSGSFHVIIGLLLLFGFNLPETNRRYFLASSLTDYWRRVNIYWKDFIMKLFFYPAYFRLKKLGPVRALVLATGWAFFMTWFLHLYQSWWLTGSADPSWQDSIFWLVMGLAVLANGLWEMKRGRKRDTAATARDPREVASLLLRTGATFCVVCLLWSFWTCPSPSVWLAMWRHADLDTLLGGMVVVSLVMAAKFVMEVLPAMKRTPAIRRQPSTRGIFGAPELGCCVVPLLVMAAAAHEGTRSIVPEESLLRLGERVAVERLFDVLEAGDSFPPERDFGEVNYYNNLVQLDEGNIEFWETLLGVDLNESPPPNRVDTLDIVDDFRLEVLKPSVSGAAFECSDFRTNPWGMRDRYYSVSKPEGTIRVAVLGSSHVMGYGIHEDETFEAVLERRLAAEFAAGQVVEVLNFGAPAYAPLSQRAVLDFSARNFEPDVVVLVGHLRDLVFENYRLRKIIRRDLPLPEFLQDIVEKADVGPTLHDGLVEKRLEPYELDVMGWSFRQVVEGARAMGAKPVYAFVPAIPDELPLTAEKEQLAQRLIALASDAGFVVKDLSDVFDGHPIEELQVGIDAHTNAKGHALIGERLFELFLNDPQLSLFPRAIADTGHNSTF